MTTPGLEKANQAFLQASMGWIRAALQARSASVAPPEKQSAWPWRKAPVQLQDAKPVQEARAAMEQLAAANPDLPLVVLAKRFGMSPFERDTLLLAASAEIDSGMTLLMGDAPADSGKRYPTFALAMALFADPSWDALSPERPLRAHRLLEVHQAGTVSLLSATLRIDERIASYIKGLDYLDERLVPFLTPVADPGTLPPSQEVVAEELHRWLSSEDARGLLQLAGNHSSAKSDVVGRAAALAGRKAFAVQADALPSSAEDLATFERLWSREARLQPLVLLIQGVEGVKPLAGEDGKTLARQRFPRQLSRIGGPCLMDVRQSLPELDAVPIVPVSPPADLERRALWCAALTMDGHAPSEPSILRLAGEFKSSASQLAEVAGRARAIAHFEGGDLAQQAEIAVEQAWADRVLHAGAALAGVTRWIEPRVTIEDVKLPTMEKTQLERLILHARQRSVVQSDFGFGERGDRGLGLAALFHGESGTGKTLAAEAVAHALSLGLAVAELATLKSKYIGETEKNLRRVFDAAEEGGAVLFFDEADALFGKRSEVKDSHDRYANIEINYLLMRMETFRGVAILATNQKHALDPAFMRRLRFVVGFPFPGVAERKAIWQSVFPAHTPVGQLDYDRLARFQLSGGNIFNAAFAAAHQAAARTVSGSGAQVEDGGRAGCRPLGASQAGTVDIGLGVSGSRRGAEAASEGTRMRVRLTIDRVVLDGMDLSPVERTRVLEDLRLSLTESVMAHVRSGNPTGRRARFERAPLAGGLQPGVRLGTALGSTVVRQAWMNGMAT